MPYYRCAACGLTSYSAASHSTAAACPSCSAALAENARIHVVPGARHDLSWSLVAQPHAAAQARRVIGGLPLPEATRRTLALLVSELVTNSVLHARLAADDTVDLHVNNGHGHVRVAVHDGGAGFSIPTEPADPLGEGGRGLEIAAALSDTWGVDCEHEGCTVWCDVAIEEEPKPRAADEVATGHVRELAIEMKRAAAKPGSLPAVERSGREPRDIQAAIERGERELARAVAHTAHRASTWERVSRRPPNPADGASPNPGTAPPVPAGRQ